MFLSRIQIQIYLAYAMTNFDNDEALYRFQLIWKSLRIDAALKEKGIQEGQTVRIRDMAFEFKE